MKKWIFLFCISIVMTFFSSAAPKQTEANVYARSYIVMDAYSKEVLEGKEYHLARSVASISKIMTAILALESSNLFNVVTIGEEIKTIDGSAIYLEIDEQITVLDLVYGLMLRSGNDAAVSIACNVAPSIASFVDKMNQKAQEIGLKKSVFSNPHGLDVRDGGNVSTAYDMALLMQYCLQNPLFCEIISTENYRSKHRIFHNKNRLLYRYDALIGGKTGFTAKAKRTLVNAAEKDGQRLIVVTLDCGSDFAFHQSLFEKYFSTYRYIIYFYKGENEIEEYRMTATHVIGLRLSKQIVPRGVKVYAITHDPLQVTIAFITEQGLRIEGGTFPLEMIERKRQ